ncbi:MAG TPA: WG repeat-containing protein, partial [Bacteroidia bacterium]|nr:WG repeat-containing protein [Bacteroidia bacterium]
MARSFSPATLVLLFFLLNGNLSAQHLHLSTGGNDRYGLKDDNGIWIVEPNYLSIEAYYYEYPVVNYWIVESPDSKYGIIDSTGKIFLDAEYHSVVARNDLSSRNIFHDPFKPFPDKDSIVIERPCGFRKLKNGEYYYGTDNLYWGLADSTGKMLTPPIYKAFVYEPSFGKYIRVSTTDSSSGHEVSGYLDVNGNVIIKPQWEVLSPPVKNGVLVADKWFPTEITKCGFLSWDGKFTPLEFIYEGSGHTELGNRYQYATDSVILGRWKNRVCMMDPDGKIILPPTFDDIEIFTQDNICTFRIKNKYGVVNTKGKILLSGCDSIESVGWGDGYYYTGEDPEFKHDLIFQKNGKLGVFNDSAGVVVKCVYDHAGWEDEAHTVFWGERKGKIFFAAMKGKKTKAEEPIEALQHVSSDQTAAATFPMHVDSRDFIAKFDAKGNIIHKWDFGLGYQLDHDEHYSVTFNGKTGVFDHAHDTVLIPLIYQDLGYYTSIDYEVSPFIYVETKSGHYGGYNEQGKMIIDTLYTQLGDFNPFYYCGIGKKDDGSWDAFDTTGKVIVHSKDEILMLPQTSLLLVKTEKGDRLFDVEKDSIVFEHDYDELSPLPENFFLINKDGKYGVMDENGTIIAPPVYQQIDGPFTGVFRVWKNDELNGLIDGNGNFISPLSDTGWVFSTQQFDTLISCRELWYQEYEYFFEPVERHGPDEHGKGCVIGKCTEANYYAAENFVFDEFLSSDALDEDVWLERNFDQVYF